MLALVVSGPAGRASASGVLALVVSGPAGRASVGAASAKLAALALLVSGSAGRASAVPDVLVLLVLLVVPDVLVLRGFWMVSGAAGAGSDVSYRGGDFENLFFLGRGVAGTSGAVPCCHISPWPSGCWLPGWLHGKCNSSCKAGTVSGKVSTCVSANCVCAHEGLRGEAVVLVSVGC